MVLKVIENGKHKDVHIREGEVGIMPGCFPCCGSDTDGSQFLVSLHFQHYHWAFGHLYLSKCALVLLSLPDVFAASTNPSLSSEAGQHSGSSGGEETTSHGD